MHEMSLTRVALEAVLESFEQAQAQAQRIQTIDFSIGEARDVIVPLFEKYFHYLAKDTVAADANIVITTIPLRLACRDCGYVYPANQRQRDSWQCPQCGKLNYELYSGMEFTIDRIEVI